MKNWKHIIALLLLIPAGIVVSIILISFFGFPIVDELRTQFAVKKNSANQYILNDEIGYIYNVGIKGEFRRYSVRDNKWEMLDTHGYALHGIGDISNNVLAYQETKNGESKLILLKLPDFSVISTIPGRYDGVRVDPTGKYVCLLKSVRSFIVKQGATTWGYPDECSMAIYSVESGQKINDFKDTVLRNGLDWSPDSSKIIFVKIKDRNLVPELSTDTKDALQNSTITLANEPPRYIYSYDIQNNSTTEICQGGAPQWSHDGKKMLYSNGFTPSVYSFDNKESKLFDIGRVYGEYRWSPTDKNLVALIPNPFPPTGKLMIINFEDPKARIIIDKYAVGNFVWAK